MNDDRFRKQPAKSALSKKFEDKANKLNPLKNDKIEKIKKEVRQDREKAKRLKDSERFEETKIDEKKRNFGPLQGIVDVFQNLRKPKSAKEREKSKKELIEKREQLVEKVEGLAVRDIIAPLELEIDFKDIVLEKTYHRTYFVSGYPRFVGPNWLSPIINFEHSLRISSFYYPVPTAEILKKLKKKIGEMEATLYSQMEKRKVVDPSMKVALTDAQQMQDAIAEGTEKFFHFAMYITIEAEDKDTLDKIGKNVINTLAAVNVQARAAWLQQEQGFISTQPLGVDKLFITRNMDTTSLATTFPFVTSELTMDHGIMYGINQHNNSLVIFDRFEMENANAVVFAKSGAGKSYFIKLEAVRSMMMGAELIIIDPEREYEDLCAAVEGSYISFSQGKGDKMNPFELSGLGDEDDDELRMKILALQGFFKIMLGGNLTNVEQSILDRALLLTYREKGITLDPKTQRNADYPLLEDLYKVLKGMSDPEARNMSSRLERFIIGSGAGVFNERSTVSLNNPFTVFSIRDMPEELKPMAMYLMLDYIWTKVRLDKKRRILIVDEAWYMMQSEDSAKFMYSIAKRARKYYLGLSTITQDVDDFLKNDMGRAIVTNSAMQFLMKQSPSAIDKLVQTFNLSQGESQFLLNCEKGSGLFFAGANHVEIQVVSSQAEHELITTDPKDLEKMKESGYMVNDPNDTRSIQELSMMYSPDVSQASNKAQVDIESERTALRRSVTERKSEIKDLMKKRIDLNSPDSPEANAQFKTSSPILEATEGYTASGYNPQTGEFKGADGQTAAYGSLTDKIAAERKSLKGDRTHITPQGIIGDDEDI